MKILSMTATFGKLVNRTLTLQPGMNIIHAPNEWGKSTWCAFVEAMLYGIDTGSRSKAGFLADKEHYAPWSGEPMSGRMDILWQGRAITIERQSKGRTPLGEIKAYETETGLSVPELAVSNCGEVLLGVERSVFVRAGFLKQSQMPVTEDEKLRRRLNELVTTGDESGDADLLSQKLKDLKNRCRFNKKGLLPEVEAQLAELEEKLESNSALQSQMRSITQRQEQLQEQLRLLENHKAALSYRENLAYTQKMAEAQVARDMAARELEQAETACIGLPSQGEVEAQVSKLQNLRDDRESLLVEAQMLPQMPVVPVGQEAFRGKDPQKVIQTAQMDEKILLQLKEDLKRPISIILGAVLGLLGLIAAMLIPGLYGMVGGCLLLLVGIALLVAGFGKQKKLNRQISALEQQYRGIAPDNWVAEAERFATEQQTYQATLQTRQQEQADMNRRMEENKQAMEAVTGGLSAGEFLQRSRQILEQHHALQEAHRRCQQAEAFLEALSESRQEIAPPTFPDALTETSEETNRKISEGRLEQQILRQRLGQCQGQMESLGQAEELEAKQAKLLKRKECLEQYYRALVLAMQTQEEASRELQRRFAPRISQRAQALFSRLTDGRYQRLALSSDLSVESAAEGENILHSNLWRSDGTADQLYLALRLAVAEELTPTAPLILDDALVRFDDARMAAALKILKEESNRKQVILFTCQSREENEREDS